MFYATYTFRELRSEAELLEHFRLRFEAFSELPWYASTLAGNQTGLDVDEYDGRSRHFGVFKRGLFGAKMIGGLRVVDVDKNKLAFGFLQKHPDFEHLELASSFKFKDSFPLGERELIKFGFQTDGKVVEPGRFFLLSKHRSHGLAFFSLASVATVIIHNGVNLGVIDCRKSHVQMYQKIGFCLIDQHPQLVGHVDSLMAVDNKRASEHIPNFAEKLAEWSRTGCLTARLPTVTKADLRYLWKKWRRDFFPKKPGPQGTNGKVEMQGGE